MIVKRTNLKGQYQLENSFRHLCQLVMLSMKESLEDAEISCHAKFCWHENSILAELQQCSQCDCCDSIKRGQAIVGGSEGALLKITRESEIYSSREIFQQGKIEFVPVCYARSIICPLKSRKATKNRAWQASEPVVFQQWRTIFQKIKETIQSRRNPQ